MAARRDISVIAKTMIKGILLMCAKEEVGVNK
jgi:hypothetical protein